PDGHYKLFWDGDTGKHDKMKVFWVECEAQGGGESPGGGTGGTGSTGSTGSTGGTGSTSGSGTSGEELGLTGGVQGVSATPPPTDSVATTATQAGSDWLPLILGLVGLASLIAFVVPTRLPIRVTHRDRGR